MMVELTKTQCARIASFIEEHLLDEIREDMSIDNLGWVRDLANAHKSLLDAAEGAEDDRTQD